MRTIKIILNSLFLILMTLFIGIGFLLITDAGLHFAWYMSSRFVPGDLKVQNLHGSILQGMSWDTLSYHDQGIQISLGKTQFFWHLSDFLKNKPIRLSVMVSNGALHFKKSENEGKKNNSSVNLNFLKYVDIFSSGIGHVNINYNNDFIDEIHFLKISTDQNGMHYLNFKSAQMILSGNYTINWNPKFSCLLNLKGDMQNSHVMISGEVSSIWNLIWRGQIQEINNLFPNMKGALIFSGEIHGKRDFPQLYANIEGKDFFYRDFQIKRFQALVNTRPQDSSFDCKMVIQDFSLNAMAIPQIDIHSQGRVLKDSVRLHSVLNFDTNNTIQVKADLPLFEKILDKKENMNVDIVAQIKNLKFIKKILSINSFIKVLDGNISMHSNISRQKNKLKINSQVEIANAKLFMPDYGITLHANTLNLNQQDNDISFQGRFMSGKGWGELSGKLFVNPSNYSDISARLILNGTALQAYRTNEYQLDISPDVQMDYMKGALTLKGNIHVPYARIEPEDFNGFISLPDDVVIVSNKKKSNSDFFKKFKMQLGLILDHPVLIKYKNFHGKLSGNLILIQQPGSNLNAAGQLIVTQGRYRAYGRELNIQDGRLIYANNLLTDPGLDIRAVTTIKMSFEENQSYLSNTVFSSNDSNVRTAGVLVRGTLQKPNITLFSAPPGLSQGDILSYILFDAPQSKISGANSLALLNMASGMHGGLQTPDIPKKIQKKLGLTELGVGTREFTTTENASQSATMFNIGKSLGEHLSIHYSHGLFENVSIFNLRYKINKYFTLQSETSTFENGGDILYQTQSDE